VTRELIRSKDNAQVKAARQLHETRARRSQGRMLVEGVRLLRDAWEAGFRPELCFTDPDSLGASSIGAALLRDFVDAGVPLLECTPAVFATLSETVTPQGIAAVLPLPRVSPPPVPDFVLVLDGVRDPGNAGTLLRSAEAAGVEVVLFGPGSVDAIAPKVVRSAMGAHFRLAIEECASWQQVQSRTALDGGLFVAAAHARLAYDEVEWTRPSALIVGGEASGASAEALAAAIPIAIPMQGRVESLNAAMAGTVILFEIARQRRQRS
jgi:RNA methyltransferase, TrmH family